MRFPPFPSLSVTARVVFKALIVVVAINFICLAAVFNPVAAITRFNLWGLVGHGRARLMYMTDVQNGQLPVEAMLATHELAYTPKAADEFRVVILGNSGPYGAGLFDDETLSSQMTHLDIRVNGKHLVAYNLSFPSANVVSSSVILDAALAYQPDLVIWFVTANMFNNHQTYWDQLSVFFLINRERLENIASRYEMTDWIASRMSPRPSWDAWIGIHDQGTFSVWLSSLFYPFVQPNIQHTTWRIAQDAVPAEPNNFLSVDGAYPVFNDTWQFLEIGNQMAQSAGANLLIVNQPTMVLDSPYGDVSYSKLYGRAFYDAYHEALAKYTKEQNLWYVDLWRLVSPDHYTDSELHLDAEAWTSVAAELRRNIELHYS